MQTETNSQKRIAKLFLFAFTIFLFNIVSTPARAGVYLVFPLWESGTSVAGSSYIPSDYQTYIFCSTNNPDPTEKVILHFMAKSGWTPTTGAGEYTKEIFFNNTSTVIDKTIEYSTANDSGFINWVNGLYGNPANRSSTASPYIVQGRLEIQFINSSINVDHTGGAGKAPTCTVTIANYKDKIYAHYPMTQYVNYP